MMFEFEKSFESLRRSTNKPINDLPNDGPLEITAVPIHIIDQAAVELK